MLLEFSDSPIGTDDQIASYISKMELLIRSYPKLDESLSPIKDQKNQLRAAYKAVMAAYEQLFAPGETLQYLRDSYAYLNDPVFVPPDPDDLQASFGKILWMIDHQMLELKDKRQPKVPESVHKLTTALAVFYVAEFGSWPEIATRKPRNLDKAPPLQHPFTHFLDVALDALVVEGHISPDERPRDIKYLIKKSVEKAKFHHVAQFVGERAKINQPEN